jgi:hypothetical protein
MAAKKKPTSSENRMNAGNFKSQIQQAPILEKAVAMVKKRLSYSDVKKYGYDFSSVQNLANEIGDVHSEGADWNRYSASITDQAYKAVAAEYIERAKKSNALRKAVGPVGKPAAQKAAAKMAKKKMK